jgi:hypothetical protein
VRRSEAIALRLKSMVSATPDFGETWAERERRAAMTADVDFGCQWEGGKCAAQRKESGGPVGASPMGCCRGCVENVGYLEKVNPESVTVLEKLFDRRTGFWRAENGCQIPRKWRSQKCLTFNCYATKQNADKLYQIVWHGAKESIFIEDKDGILKDRERVRLLRILKETENDYCVGCAGKCVKVVLHKPKFNFEVGKILVDTICTECSWVEDGMVAEGQLLNKSFWKQMEVSE